MKRQPRGTEGFRRETAESPCPIGSMEPDDGRPTRSAWSSLKLLLGLSISVTLRATAGKMIEDRRESFSQSGAEFGNVGLGSPFAEARRLECQLALAVKQFVSNHFHAGGIFEHHAVRPLEIEELG